MANYDTSVRVHTSVNSSEVDKLDKKMQTLSLRVEKASHKAENLKAQMDALANKRIPTEDYIALEKEIGKISLKYSNLTKRADNFLGSKRSGSWRRLQADIENTRNELNELFVRKNEYEKSGHAYIQGSDTEKYKDLATKYRYADEELSILLKRQAEYKSEAAATESIRVNAKVKDADLVKLAEERAQIEERITLLKKAGVTVGYKEYDELTARLREIDREIKKNVKSMKQFPKIADRGAKAMRALRGEGKKTGSIFSTLGSRFKGILLSLLIFNWITKGFNAMVSGMKKGFQNLAKYSSEYNKNMSEMKGGTEQLQNGMAAAFEPVMNFIVPALNSLIGKLNEASEHVSRFFAIISGKSSYTRAKKQVTDYAATLENASNDVRNILASFDDLNVLDTSSSANSGKSGDEMFEEVPLDAADISMYDLLCAKVADLAEQAAHLKAIFDEGFFEGIGDYNNTFDSIKMSLQGIKDALIHVWTDTDVMSACDGWIKSVVSLLGTASGSILSVGLTLSANLLGGIEQYLAENEGRIKEYLISMFNIGSDINDMLSDFLASFAYVFSAFAGENGMAVTSALIGIFADAFMGITQLCGEMTASLIEMLTKPFTDNADSIREALEGTLGVIATLLASIKEIVDGFVDDVLSLYEEHIKPVIYDLTEIASKFVGDILTWINDDILPVLQSAADDISSIVNDNILPIIDNVEEAIGGIIDILSKLYEDYLKDILEWISKYALPVLTIVFRAVMSMFTSLLRTATTKIKGITQILKGLVEFIGGIFTGDMEKAFQGLKDIFAGFKTFVGGVVNGIIGIVEVMANGVVDAINLVIRSLNKLSFEVPDWVPIPDLRGKSWGFNLTELPKASFPRVALATGGIAMGPTKALIGEAGREAVLPLDNNTEWMDELADRIGVSRGPVTVVLEIDGREFARAEVPYIDAENSRIGTDLRTT